MRYILESNDLEDYLENLDGIINFEHPVVKEVIAEIEQNATTMLGKAELAFLFARDEISHSFDTGNKLITISASDAIINRAGICFAKSHVLAALLRGMGIPTGFCYQRVTRKGTVESGYALHGLNAFYLAEYNQWFRLDPRGNKEGVHSEFSIQDEKLAYPIRAELDEVDYPNIFTRPLEAVITAMKESSDCQELFYLRPERI